MVKRFDYAGAKKEGYSDEEIMQFLSEQHPKFDLQGALKEGYSPAEINNYLSTYKPQKSKIEKAGRLAQQFGLAAAERAVFPLELGMQAQASPEAQQVPYRENVAQDIERLLEQKASGQWDDQDESLLKSLKKQIGSTTESGKYVKPIDLTVRGVAEKVTGQELHPEGVLEKAASWAGFIKNPKNLAELRKLGSSPKELLKAIVPGETALRGLGAGTALEIAEEGGFGPVGTMGAALVGDIMGHTASGTIKALAHPKQTLAKGTAMLASRRAKQAILQDFKEGTEGSKYLKDLGTITDNRVIQMIQARMAASGLTGKELEEFRRQMTQQIIKGYENVVKELGEATFETRQEAGEVAKDFIKRARDTDKKIHEDLYERARKRITPESKVVPYNLGRSITAMEADLAPGSLKSADQQKLLETLEKLKSDVFSSEGNLKEVSINDLMNDKVALQDLVDYELQGGQLNRAKKLIEDIDRAIQSYGIKDKKFVELLNSANKKFQSHVQKFRNKNLKNIFKSEDPMSVMNKMNSPQGIRDLKKALYTTAKGKQVFNQLARKKVDLMIGDSLTDSISEQLKAGKFVNILDKGKNKELIAELLSKEAIRELHKLQKHVAELARSAQKFFNASQSATAGADLATLAGLITGVFGIFTGNPWILSGVGTLATAKIASKLMADPQFLKMVEEAILASAKNDTKLMQRVSKKTVEYINQTYPGLIENAAQSQ